MINFNTKSTHFCFYFLKTFDALKVNILINCQNHLDFTQIRQILDSQKYRNWTISNIGINITTQFRNSGLWYRNWKPYIRTVKNHNIPCTYSREQIKIPTYFPNKKFLTLYLFRKTIIGKYLHTKLLPQFVHWWLSPKATYMHFL